MGDNMIGSLGLNLRILRFKLNLPQYKVAEILGISAKELSDYERDLEIPSTQKLIKIANFYCVNVRQLVEEDL